MSHSNYPISCSLLEIYLPHRPPMRWVDEVLSIHANGGRCRVYFDSQAHYCTSEGEIRRSSYIEWMAQSYGFVKASQVYMGALTVETLPKTTFLAQIKNASFEAATGKSSLSYDISVTCIKELGPLSLVKGEVYNECGKLISTAELKLFAQ